MNIREVPQYIRLNRQLIPIISTLVPAMFLLAVARFFEVPFDNLISVATYLTWHNLYELNMVIFSIAIFLVTFFTYRQTQRLRTMLFGNLLLASGVLEAFHMLSYKGMPAFFTENATANRATTLWISARLILSLAFLIGANIPDKVKSTVNRLWFFLAALLIPVVIFAAATWYPSFLPAMYVDGQGMTPLKIFLEYLVMLILLAAAISYFRTSVRSKDKMSLSLTAAMILGIMSEFAFTQYMNIYDIYNYIGHLLAVCSMLIAFVGNFARNVQEPYLSLTIAQRALSEHSMNLEKTIEQRTRQLKHMNVKLLEDLEFARGIQKSMLPAFLPDTSRISFNAVYLPTERISGDFYDVFMLDDSNIGFYVCDVSGHGVPAAMLTVFMKQCIDNIVETDRHKGTWSSPSEMLKQIYGAFNHSNFSDDVYIVLIYCMYNIPERKLSCSSAGMNVKPLLTDSRGGIRELDISGFPICKLEGIHTAEFPQLEITTDNGDRLYLYTDGLTEARSSSGQSYTDIRLKQLLCDTHESKLYDQASLITDSLMDFSAGQKYDDDVTLLAVEFR